MNLLLQNISFGNQLKTYGQTTFIKYPGSKITLGANLRFRSYFESNTVGLFRRNILSTMTKEAEIRIGDNSGFSGVAISAANSIVIGRNVMIGANVTITDTDWHSVKAGGAVKSENIMIGDNVWIGLNSTVLKGVEIGENSVIGAHSLVTRSIPSNCIAGGNPCKVIKFLADED